MIKTYGCSRSAPQVGPLGASSRTGSQGDAGRARVMGNGERGGGSFWDLLRIRVHGERHPMYGVLVRPVTCYPSP